MFDGLTSASTPTPRSPAVPSRGGVAAFFSRTDRGGDDWELPQRLRVFVFGGNVRLDLRRARFHAGTSVIEVVAIMGEVRIIVPHGLRVESDGSALAAEFSVTHVSDGVPREDAPLIRVTGRAVMGKVSVRVVDPDAAGWTDRWKAWLDGRP
jgi:cell wall-active antibiotic response 4TMS protein YvqF